MNDTVSSVLLKILKKHNIKFMFGLPAAQLALVMDGAGRDPHFSYLTTRHEEACGHMAHAISKVTDSIGVCFGTVGPGVMNMVPGVAAAWADNIPLLVLTPNNQVGLIEPGKELLQNANQLDIYRPITKWSAVIRQAERAPELVERAIHVARSGRPGPVQLDIPCDIGAQACQHDVNSIPAIPVPRPVPSSQEMDSVVDACAKARRPVLLAGGGVVRSGGTEAFRSLVDSTGFPVTTTLNARGVVPMSCKSHLGSGGVLAGSAAVRALSEADLILSVGCKFSSWTTVDKPPRFPVPAGQKIIQVDIDAECLGRSVPCTQGLQADAREFLKVLNDSLSKTTYAVDDTWKKAMLDEYKTYRSTVNSVADDVYTEGTKIYNEAAVARAISKVIPEDAIVAFDGGQVMEWYQTFIHPGSPEQFIFNPGMGHLGIGLPAANAAKLAHPDKPVICLSADGAMAFTMQELETAARYSLNTITIVANDSHWGMYKPLGESVFQNENFGTRLSDINFAGVAQNCGCYGERIEDLDDLPAAFNRAVEAARPAVLEVAVEYTPHPMDYFWPETVLRGMEFKPVEV